MKIYHIFTNNNDEWTESYKEAKKIYKDFIKEYGNARLYEEIYEKDNEEMIEEKYLLGYGSYPQ